MREVGKNWKFAPEGSLFVQVVKFGDHCAAGAGTKKETRARAALMAMAVTLRLKRMHGNGDELPQD